MTDTPTLLELLTSYQEIAQEDEAAYEADPTPETLNSVHFSRGALQGLVTAIEFGVVV